MQHNIYVLFSHPHRPWGSVVQGEFRDLGLEPRAASLVPTETMEPTQTEQ